MKHYIELTLLHNTELPANFLLQKVYTKLHFKFANLKSTDNLQPVGISFPRYEINVGLGITTGLGDKIRLFSEDEQVLVDFNVTDVLSELVDYVHISDIQQVPEKVSYGHYRRVQVQSNMIRVARRKAKREGITLEEATERLSQFEETHTSLPFINLGSKSTNQHFKLFVYCERVKDKAVGAFSTYGLSASSTVPIF